MTKLPYVLTLVVVVAAGCAAWTVWRNETRPSSGSLSMADDSLPSEPGAAPLTEFTLDERGGRPIVSQALEGKVWVASFFFTTCPGSCVRLNQALQSLHDDASLGGVRFVSISCDPDTDTLDLLGEYAQRFGADPQRWLFCRGDLDYVQRIGRDMMHLAVQRQTHSDRAAVIDRTGTVRGRFIVTDPNQLERMRQLLATCLQEPVASLTEDRDSLRGGLTAVPQSG